MMVIVVVLLAALGSSPAISQTVFKCVDERGRIAYSQTACYRCRCQQLTIQENSVDTSGLRQRAAALNAREQREALEREIAAAEYETERVSRSRPRANDECSRSESAYQSAKSRQAPPSTMQSLKNRVRNACSRDPYGSSSSGSGSMPAPAPTVITNCDAGGCWDNMGGRYNKGGGNTYFPSSGGACQMVGGQMHCP